MCCAIAWKLLAGCSLSRQNCFVPGRHQAIKIDTQISSGPLYLRNILVLSWQHQQESENYQLYTQCLYSLCKEFSIAFIHNSNAVQHHQKNEILKLTNCQASKLLHWGSSKSFLLQPKETSKWLEMETTKMSLRITFMSAWLFTLYQNVHLGDWNGQKPHSYQR